MQRINITGLRRPDIHFMLPSTACLRAENVRDLIENQSYFVVHAPRQVGKTTTMSVLVQELIAAERFLAVHVSVEVGVGFPDDIGVAELAILNSWRWAIEPANCYVSIQTSCASPSPTMQSSASSL